MTCVVFFCGWFLVVVAHIDFDVLVDLCDFDIVEFDVVLVIWCGFGTVDAGWW